MHCLSVIFCNFAIWIFCVVRFLRRYSSTIYGQYRPAGLKWGLAVGAAMAVVMLLAGLCGPQVQPAAPENYITDIVMLLGMLVAAYRYRRTLEEERVTLKELMLLGLWVGFMASLVYGLLLWLYGMVDGTLVERFAEGRLALMPPAETDAQGALNIELVQGYTAGDWGFIGGFRSAVISILLNLVAALVMRTEKAPVRSKK